ncbi:MAG TPA: glycosyltransferase, partial [Acetobacteraceae bacterium]|nr:glycosyltransferase [Acetobacteraceae bacterium]
MNDGLMWTAEPAALSAPDRRPSPLMGNLDGVHGRCVEGWVFDAETPETPLVMEVFDRDRLLGEAPANLFRADLAAAGIGDGSHSFRFLLPLELFDGHDHEIHARVQGHAHALSGSPRRLSTKPLIGAAAFPAYSEISSAPPPLSDAQFTMLRSLHALTDALVAQTKVLQEFFQRQFPGAPPAIPAKIDAEPPCLLITQALACPRGEHDYIIFSIIDWAFRIQRPQHLARSLARMGNRVFYLSIRFDPLETGRRRFSIRSSPAENVFEVALRCRPPAPSIYAGFDDPMQIEELRAAVAELASELRMKSPVGLVQFPSWLPVTASVPGMLLVFDCLDHLAGFTGVAPRVVELEETLIREADCVTVTSDFLSRMVSRQRSCEMVRNAAEVAYFSRRPAKVYEPASRPVIGYYGAIADWFDIDLVTECARRNPDWRFVLIGEVTGCDITAAKQLTNVEFLGEKPYKELTFYLYGFDVCIIPFKLVDLIKATNPVKAYEYLCAGKPVVATDLPELRLLPPRTVEIAGSAAEFESRIAECLTRDDPALVSQRKRWAARHSWDARARKLRNLIAAQYPRVSVVVLCHNNLQFTQACLSSLLEFSDYPDLEVICVDNASSDGTQDYLTGLAVRHGFVRYIRNEEN